jgi:adenosylcobinamide-GDP ribazoletransferase
MPGNVLGSGVPFSPNRRHLSTGWRSRRPRLLHDLKVALLFLTRLPVRSDAPLDLSELAAAAHLFPVVGALVGGCAALAYWAAILVGLPSLPASIAALATLIAVTGALHEDGLADTADSLGAGADRERALAIMRDSRIGTYGTIALVLALLARLIALAGLWEPAMVAGVLIAVGALSRAALPVVMLVQPPARRDGLAAAAGRPPPLRAAAGCALALLVALACLPTPQALVAALTVAAVAGLVAWRLARRFGGYTGDTLGAVQQAAEVAFLMAIVAQA